MNKPEITVTVKDPNSGKTYTYRRETDKSLVMLHPDKGTDVLRLTMGPDNTPEVTILDLELAGAPQLRTAEDSGRCLQECARECEGDMLCSAACIPLCLTILV